MEVTALLSPKEEYGDTFQTLYSLDVTDRLEQKSGFDYLSWAWAWAEVKKKYPDSTYEVKFFDGKPYLYDPDVGYMVFTSVTINGLTHDMWLPVLDGANKAMKAEMYKYRTKKGEASVEPATMYEINKAIMRCLVKNLAMHGIGLSVYYGESVAPEAAEAEEAENERQQQALLEMIQKVSDYGSELVRKGVTTKDEVCEVFAKYAGGKKNPKLIASVEDCEKCLTDLSQFEEAKKK